jgi:hypothetical protein
MNKKYLYFMPIFLFSIAFMSALDISTCQELQDINLDLTATYDIVNDIDCSATSGWNGGAGFIPIGEDVNYDMQDYGFNGTLDGHDYTISNLYINNNSRTSSGLFVGINSMGWVTHLNLENIDITGGYNAGGIAGWNFGTIEISSITGDITATSIAGGIAGFSFNSVDLCYSKNGLIQTTSSAYGSNAGGLVAFVAGGSITNSWSNMEVDIANRRGGLLGYLQSSSVSNSYSYGNTNGHYCLIGDVNGGNGGNSLCDIETSGTPYTTLCTSGSWSGEGFCNKSTSEMKNIQTYLDAGWTITEVEETLVNNGYPYIDLLSGDWVISVEPIQEAEENQILGVMKFWEFDKLENQTVEEEQENNFVQQTFFTTDKVTGEKVSIFAGIINWFKNLFN